MTTRSRILQVLYSGLGGHAAVAMPLIEAGGSDDPWEHRLLFYGIEPVAAAYRDMCTQKGIQYDYVPAQQGRPWAGWPRLSRAIRAMQPDAVILHSIKTVVPARWAARGIPLLAVEHQANALKTRSEWGASLTAQFLADRVITLSPDYQATLAQKLGPAYRSTRATLIPTGVDLSSFTLPRKALGNGRKIRIGMAGRFTPTKAQEVLISALAHLSKRAPQWDWELSLAGDGVRFETVWEAARSAGVDERVKMLGHIAPERLPSWFANLDIYAHASDGETLSTALLQAMAAGVPIVASDVVGISDLLTPSSGSEDTLGHLVPVRDAEAFANAIIGVVHTPDQAILRATRAQEHVVQYHNPTKMRAGYAELLKDLL